MLFSSISFLYYFLPAFLVLYFIAPKKLKNAVILLASLVFYGIGEPKYLLLITAAILIGYIAGLVIASGHKKSGLLISVLTLVGLLVYFKYAMFFAGSFATVFGLPAPAFKIALPIGISFYTFQILSYVADVYRGDKPQRNIISFAAYVTMFPQLIAGPIVRYSDISGALTTRTTTPDNVYHGLSRFIIGLSKKVIVANNAAALCDIFRASSEKSVAFHWLYAIALMLYIYFDFSGYSDMAIGLGRVMGFDFPENFDYPYMSKSVTEFWRRWHMTLGRWFRDYVYIPLGGNRVSRIRWILNILVVWSLTGLWHGAAWNFVLWGLFFAVLLVFEKLTGIPEKLPAFVARIYTLFLIAVSFVIFNASSVSGIAGDLGGMFGLGGVPLITAETVYYFKSYFILLVVGIVGSTPALKQLRSHLPKSPFAELPVLVVLLLLSTAFLVDGSFNPFLYFRF